MKNRTNQSKKVKILHDRIPVAYYAVMLFICFTLFIFAPYEIFFTNIGDMQFSISDLIPFTMLLFMAAGATLWTILKVLHFLSSKVANVVVVLLFSVFLAFYIQGNYLPTDYGLLNGEQVDWNAYPVDGIISAVLWISIPVILLFVLYVKKFNKLQKVIKVVAICIVLVQFVTLVIVGVSTGGFSSREKYVATDKNEFTMSKNENIVVLLLDTLDSRVFSNYLESKEGAHYKEMLKDFTYYRNTTAMYAYTDLAIPYILSGYHYQNGVSYEKYVDNAYANAKALKYLANHNWSTNVYTATTIPQKELGYNIENIQKVKLTVSSHRKLASYIYNIVGYRYLLYQLKRFCWFYPDDVEQLISIEEPGLNFFEWSNYSFDNDMEGITVDENDNTFHFYHLEGTHIPFTMNSDFSGCDTETSIEAETQGIMVMVDHYLNLLKEKDIYDNTAIVIMADHGYTGMRQSPVLLIKGINEKKQFQISDAPVSFSDLQDIMIGLAEHKTTDEITSLYSQDRIRDYYFYDVTSKDGIKSMSLDYYKIKGDSFDDEVIVKAEQLK